MIKLVSDTINKDDINRLVNWLSQEETPILTKNKVTLEFEDKWCKKLGVDHTCYVNSGSSAILLSLAALKESGKLKSNVVVAPALSWATDVSSPILIGMDVELCDCNLHDLSIDLNHFKKIVRERNPSVLILVSVLGLVPNMEEVVNICKENDIILLEDVCESMGSKYKNQYLGTFGDLSVFSLFYGHHLSTIEGGLVCSDNEELSDLVFSMRSHGWGRDWSKEKQLKSKEEYGISDFNFLYTFFHPGFNLRATDLQAYIGLNQIDKLDDFSKRRNNNFNYYQENIRGNMLQLDCNLDNFVSNFAYPVVSKNRDSIVEKLVRSGVETRPLIAGSMANKPFWKGRSDNTPNADLVDKFGFYVPNNQDLSESDMDKICNIINEDLT
jgi:CDP-6-deoxy-D-xylo-4-hexulose-3-dehydrase